MTLKFNNAVKTFMMDYLWLEENYKIRQHSMSVMKSHHQASAAGSFGSTQCWMKVMSIGSDILYV